MVSLVRILLIFLLVGCTSVELPTHEVYQNEYVIEEYTVDGFINPYPQVEGNPTLGPGVYSIDEFSNYKLITPKVRTFSESKTVEYDKENDFCLTGELQTLACSPNYVLSINNDPLAEKLWGLKTSPGVNSLAITNRKTPDVKIMVLDTGVNCQHEDIVCDTIGYNTITDDRTSAGAIDDNGHGTHVAGTIGAMTDNGKGVLGVVDSAEIVPAKFLTATGSGSLFNAIKAVKWAIDEDIDIINASFGGGGFSKPFQNAINAAKDAGILFIAAAGNSSNDNDAVPQFPSSYDNVLSVASLDIDGRLSSFSNYGKNSVDVVAPGRDILSLDYRGGYLPLSGTSMATPHVVGIAALMYQKHKALPKVERYKLAIEAITNNDETFEGVKYGQVDAVKVLNTEISVCNKVQCKQCLKDCSVKYKGKCGKLRKCKAACREVTTCQLKCQ